MLKLVVVLGALGGLAGCDSSGGSGSQANSPLVGSWTCCDGPISTTYQFNADGTVVRNVVVAAVIPESQRPVPEHGTWKVDENGNLNMAFSNGSPDPIEESHRMRVDSRTLVFADDGERGNFYRIK